MNVVRVRFALHLLDALSLPEYKGSTFRGAFGQAFKQVCCPSLHPCTGSACPTHPTCVYFQDFESLIPYKERSWRRIPHPFVIEPPLSTRQRFEAGEEISFGLVLIGKAILHYSHFIQAVERMGQIGMGRSKGRFWLIKAFSIRGNQSEQVYCGRERLRFDDRLLPVSFEDGLRWSHSEVRHVVLDFLTPMQIHDHGKVFYADEENPLPFAVFLRAVLHRLSSLSHHYSEQKFDWDYRGLIERASAVACVSSRLMWKTYGRYSRRQGQPERLRGFTGRLTYAGDSLSEFIPALMLGSYVHVGNRTSFGLGMYNLRIGQKTMSDS